MFELLHDHSKDLTLICNCEPYISNHPCSKLVLPSPAPPQKAPCFSFNCYENSWIRAELIKAIDTGWKALKKISLTK